MATKPNTYETLYLVRPDMETDKLTALQERLNKTITANQGEIKKNEKWEERNLAYPINKYNKGSYYILIYKALPTVISDLEKLFNLNKSDVLRFMTTLNEEEQLQVQEKTSRDSTEDQNISVFQSAVNAQSEPVKSENTNENTETVMGGNN